MTTLEIKATNVENNLRAISRDPCSSGFMAVGFGWRNRMNDMPEHLRLSYHDYSFVTEVAAGVGPHSRVIGDTKKPVSYACRQKKWISENSVKIGTTLIATRAAASYEDGWDTNWDHRMRVGGRLKVQAIRDLSGLLMSDGYYYPFFVMEVASAS